MIERTAVKLIRLKDKAFLRKLKKIRFEINTNYFQFFSLIVKWDRVK